MQVFSGMLKLIDVHRRSFEQKEIAMIEHVTTRAAAIFSV